MKMLLNYYGMIIRVCYCDLIWVAVVVTWWVMGHLLCFKSLCVEKLWIYKRDPAQVSYSQAEGYSAGGTYRGYSVGSGDGACTAGDGLCTGGGCRLVMVYMVGIVQVHTGDIVEVMVGYMDNDRM